MSIVGFTLPIAERKQHYDLRVPAGTLIFDAEPRYGAGSQADGVHLLAAVESSEGCEIRRFALLGVDAEVPEGWTHLVRFEQSQLLMMDEPVQGPALRAG